MQTDDVTIRVKVFDGTWEVIGVDRAHGIVPESVVLSANEWGSDTASFDLRRDPGWIWPDLRAFSDIEVEIGGQIVWTGRISETPARDGDDRVINVQCEGWQYHLDDDSYAKSYVHTRLSDWRDHRTFLNANLTTHFLPRFMAQSDQGGIIIGAQHGVVWPSGAAAGVTLDLGPGAAKRVVITAKRGPGSPANVNLFVRGHDTENAISTGSPTPENFLSTALSGISQSGSTYAGTVVTPRRYVSIYLHNSSISGYTTTADDTLTIISVQVFSDSAYESGNASVLKASTVIVDAKAQATALLSSDVSLIAATDFSIPDLSFTANPQTPREVIQAVNAFHNYRAQVDVERRLVFQPRPTAPLFEVGPWGGSTFEDSAMNSGRDVYNKVLVTGTGPDGSSFSVPRYSSDEALTSAPGNAGVNGGFEVDTSGWTAGAAGTITRDTSVFDAGVASARLNASAGGALGDVLSPAFTTTPGRRYTLRVRFRRNATWPVGGFWPPGAADEISLFGVTSAPSYARGMTIPASEALDGNDLNAYPTGSFVTVNLGFVADSTTAQLWIAVASGAGASTNLGYIDSVALYTGDTVLDRRGFVRAKQLQVSAALTTTVAQQIGDIFLAAHRTQPLRGTVVVMPGGVRHVMTGEKIPPARLLRETQQLLRLPRIDPDTGGLGREGLIASVAYTHETRTAVVALDSDRRDFEALLSRYALLSPA